MLSFRENLFLKEDKISFDQRNCTGRIDRCLDGISIRIRIIGF